MRFTGICAAIAATLVGGCLAAPAAAEDVTLKAGTFLPPVDKVWYPTIAGFVDDVNEQGKPHGLKIDMVAAGFKAMSPFEMGNAVKSGVLDLVHLSGTFYNKLMPIADAQKLSTVPVQEQRRNGAFDYLRPLYRDRMNVHYLGRWGDEVNFHFYLLKPIDGPSLDGFKIRGTSVYQAFIEALGGTMITTPPSQAYTALERGVVDGLGWPLWGIQPWGWDKLLKYRVEPGFYWAEISVLVNLDTWESLTEAQQRVLHEVQVKLEGEFIKTRRETNEAERAKQDEAGIEPIVLEGEDAEEFLSLAHKVGWEDVMKKAPEHAQKVRELTTN